MKRYYRDEEQPTTDHTRLSLEDKYTGEIPKNSRHKQITFYETTNSKLSSTEESDDSENHHLTVNYKKHQFTQKSKTG